MLLLQCTILLSTSSKYENTLHPKIPLVNTSLPSEWKKEYPCREILIQQDGCSNHIHKPSGSEWSGWNADTPLVDIFNPKQRCLVWGRQSNEWEKDVTEWVRDRICPTLRKKLFKSSAGRMKQLSQCGQSGGSQCNVCSAVELSSFTSSFSSVQVSRGRWKQRIRRSQKIRTNYQS